MIGPREILILEEILKSSITNTKQLSKRNNLSYRQISYSLEKINDELKQLEEDEIIRTHSGKWIYNLHSLQRLLHLALDGVDVVSKSPLDDYILPELRVYSEIILIAISENKIQIEELMEFTNVSRNTILLDLKKIRLILKENNCELIYTHLQGYQIKGQEENLSYLILKIVNEFLEQKENIGKIEKCFENLKPIILHIISNYENNFLLKFSDNSFRKIYFLLGIFGMRFKTKFGQKMNSINEIKNSIEYDFVQKCILESSYPYRNENDIAWLTLQFLSLNTIYNDSNLIDFQLFEVIKKMVKNFEAKSTITIKNLDLLTQRIFFHLKPALYRIKYGIPFDTVDLEDIASDKVEIEIIHDILIDCIQPIEIFIGKEIPFNEVRLLAFYFAGELLSSSSTKKIIKKRAIVVCSNGLIVANIMKQNLKELFPEINFITTSSVRDLEELSSEFDIIFSNRPIENSVPNYIVNPMMTAKEKSRLRINVLRDLSLTSALDETDNIVKIFKKYGTITDEENLQTELAIYFIKKNNNNQKNVPDFAEKKILEYLPEKNIQIISNATNDWKKMIQLACAPLLDNKEVTENYVSILIKQLDDVDSYYFLNETIAIPHSVPENGVLKESISLLISKQKIIFPGDHSVHFIIPFALKKNDNHMNLINQIMYLAKSSKIQNELLQFSNTSEVIHFLKNIFKEGEDLDEN